ncbi:DUF2087 domain-containing protein [Bacillus sp. BHET2]|uniref:DUF2087 domain-containing protein n=1 Tax=Bacillus sp. BHET2 TaxID=2583818 RepID=UPI00110EB246|nr:DUF2087 domain-containing protein [Bacillus sp. BHET2]TMU85035.1 DUF2087 domain-containing protein [Bacillus sp. BHET2]
MNHYFSRNLSIEVMEKGYVEDAIGFGCIFCEKKVTKGRIYQVDGMLYEDWYYMEHHIKKEHGDVFDVLLASGKEHTGLTEQQSKLLRLIYQGKDDGEIQKELNIGSLSTIRNHRFVLRKKERQAKVMGALMSLLNKQMDSSREEESDRIEKPIEPSDEISRFFSEEDGRLKTYQLKEYEKEKVLSEIMGLFHYGKKYSESEINQVLGEIYEDYVLLRRELVDRGFLSRHHDGSQYHVVDPMEGEDMKMDSKKELKLKAKEEKPKSGVFQLVNKENGKVFVGSSPNLKSLNGLKFELNLGSHQNKGLQQDWKQYGEEAFTFEILELANEKDLLKRNKKKVLEDLKEKWITKLNPFGEKGYNRVKKEN